MHDRFRYQILRTCRPTGLKFLRLTFNMSIPVWHASSMSIRQIWYLILRTDFVHEISCQSDAMPLEYSNLICTLPNTVYIGPPRLHAATYGITQQHRCH